MTKRARSARDVAKPLKASRLRYLSLTGTALYANVIRRINETVDEAGNVTMSTVLSVRLSDQERALLEAASLQARTNVSDFVRRKALEAAELDMMERRVVSIPAKDWERFESWANAPAREIAALKELTAKPPTWPK